MMKNVTIFSYDEMEKMRKIVEEIKENVYSINDDYCQDTIYEKINELEMYLCNNELEKKYNEKLRKELKRQEDKLLWGHTD